MLFISGTLRTSLIHKIRACSSYFSLLLKVQSYKELVGPYGLSLLFAFSRGFRGASNRHTHKHTHTHRETHTHFSFMQEYAEAAAQAHTHRQRNAHTYISVRILFLCRRYSYTKKARWAMPSWNATQAALATCLC